MLIHACFLAMEDGIADREEISISLRLNESECLAFQPDIVTLCYLLIKPTAITVQELEKKGTKKAKSTAITEKIYVQWSNFVYNLSPEQLYKR
ncbi:hypothetical protein Nepgr_028272 [Nepenthes gracilis]|uniref:Uncharacterized protein n=1 Tax=Nepenthes gracilis TaxID=150966 RepID=A0AAD3Y3Y4_NEPGR|nr:hypothetical protein Nepgr_028272 [Nepenthes gracilis]